MLSLMRPKPRPTGRTIIQEHMFALAARQGLPVIRHRPHRASITREQVEALAAWAIVAATVAYVFGYHLVRAILTNAFQVYH